MSKTFFELVRENTGSHFLDSGSAYGYGYNKAQEEMVVSFDVSADEVNYCRLSTAHFLDAVLEEDTDTQKEFEEFAHSEENENKTYGECIELFAKSKGLEVVADNTYNSENDFTQNFIFHILFEPGKDWVHDDEAIVFIQTHNGCDIRGGYSSPVVCKCPDGLADGYFLDWTVGISISSGVDEKEKELDRETMQALDEKWQHGYSSYPFGEFRDDVDVWIHATKTEAKVRLKSGETVVVYPVHNAF